jgi:CRP-like cAMP-binding protein
MSLTASHVEVENRILANLPSEELERLTPHMELIHLEKGYVLHTAGDSVQHAYFPNCGMVSLLSTTEKGATIEVAMIGDEGLVGIPIVLRTRTMPYEAMIQITAEAVKVRADVLRVEFDRGGQLQERILRYMSTLLSQISQSAVCNRFHTVETRLCRWLLVAQDRVKSDQLDLTQEIISHMLGTPRTGVTMAACALQRTGAITYSRGKIHILDRAKLERMSCECYHIVKESVDNYLKIDPAR